MLQESPAADMEASGLDMAKAAAHCLLDITDNTHFVVAAFEVAEAAVCSSLIAALSLITGRLAGGQRGAAGGARGNAAAAGCGGGRVE